MNIHVEISELMPWYVNGTLQQETSQRVRAHIETCEECQDDYAFLCRVDAAVNQAAPTPIVPQPPVEAFVEALGATPVDERPARRIAGGRTRWALAAALFAAVAIAAVLLRDGLFLPTQYTTVTSTPEVVSMDYVLRINFQNGVTEATRAATVKSLRGREVRAGEAEQSVRLVINVPGASVAEVERFTATIAARPEVRSVDIVALQLPVRNAQ